MTTAAYTALADQLNAATTDAARHQDRIAQHTGVKVRTINHHPWLHAQIITLITALTTGTARLCPHIGASPRVIHTAAWAPGHLTCTACVSALHPDGAEDSTCDRCRRPCSPIYPGMAQTGPILLAYGLCQRCARRTGLGHPIPLPAQHRR
ncbi:hypothetical protein [Streptosporangium sp. NPDC020145]|uniref:hypothetical protein n=1 Tax=Streptosporangium sp. NPDC020145 TaxID=3154694 RepID=UPI003414C48D